MRASRSTLTSSSKAPCTSANTTMRSTFAEPLGRPSAAARTEHGIDHSARSRGKAARRTIELVIQRACPRHRMKSSHRRLNESLMTLLTAARRTKVPVILERTSCRVCESRAMRALREESLAKPNYKFQKRQKDLAKQKKKEEKRLKKAARSGEQPGEGAAPESSPTLGHS